MNTINGLPAHPLFVHFVVVAVPVTALVAIAIALWPRARAALGAFPAILGLVTLIAVPITTSAGDSLKKSLPRTPELHRHSELGDQLILAVGPLFGLLALLYLLQLPAVTQRIGLSDKVIAGIDVAARGLTIVAAVASIVLVVLIGDSGAQSVWGS